MTHIRVDPTASWAPATTCEPCGRIELSRARNHADAPGCALLIHGLTGSPAELSELAARLAAIGYDCVVPLLPGHCTSVEDLSKTTLERWQEVLVQDLVALASRSPSRRVVVIGLSLGALLALWLLSTRPQLIEHLILLSPPLRLRALRDERFHRLLAVLPDSCLPLLGSRPKSRRPRGYLKHSHNAYPRHSIAAAERTLRLRDLIVRELPHMSCATAAMPKILVALDPNDHLVDTTWVKHWLSRFMKHAEILELPGGQHELTLGHHSHVLLENILHRLSPSLARPGAK